MKLEHILNLCADLGYQLLCCGADVSRAELCIRYLGTAYGVDEIHVLAIPTGFAVTMIKDEKSLSTTRKVGQTIINLGRLEELSNLSRRLCEMRPSIFECKRLLKSTLSIKEYQEPLRCLAQMAAGASFCAFFGGGPGDAAAALILGFLVYEIRRLFLSLHANSFFIQAILGFCSAFFGLAISSWGPRFFHADAIIISGIILLVPGLSFSNSMRDFLLNDIITGLSRFMEALLTALGIAVGVTAALLFF